MSNNASERLKSCRSNGRMVGQGTHAELIAQGGEYRTLYAFEFGGSAPDGK
ncbi:MAG: hypothetical protein ABSA67_01315 [Candidatus Brocadiia bacterium]